MEHSRILSPEMIDTLAHQGLRELMFAPIPKVARALSGFNREQLSTAIEVMIAMLDAADGDPDAEAGNDVEDDFALSANAMAHGDGVPGCAIADSDTAAYVEWHTTPGNLKRNGQPCVLAGHEDDEEDDAAEEDDHSGDVANEDEPAGYSQTRWEMGPGCTISDPGGGNCEDEGENAEGSEI